MSNIPQELKYTKEHEWVVIKDGAAVVGITDHAQAELGDIVFVEMPDIGRQIKQNEDFGVVESVKTVSNLYSPLSGTVTAVNTSLADAPETINIDPYGQGWIIKLEGYSVPEIEALLNAAGYQQHLGA